MPSTEKLHNYCAAADNCSNVGVHEGLFTMVTACNVDSDCQSTTSYVKVSTGADAKQLNVVVDLVLSKPSVFAIVLGDVTDNAGQQGCNQISADRPALMAYRKALNPSDGSGWELMLVQAPNQCQTVLDTPPGSLAAGDATIKFMIDATGLKGVLQSGMTLVNVGDVNVTNIPGVVSLLAGQVQYSVKLKSLKVSSTCN